MGVTLRHAVGQTDRQTAREADKIKQAISFTCCRPKRPTYGENLHLFKNTGIVSDKMDCYFGTYWPCDFQGVSFQHLLQQH